jgi:hypothetical protein
MEKGDNMKHYITNYVCEGKHIATSWLQINIFGKAFVLWEKKIEV